MEEATTRDFIREIVDAAGGDWNAAVEIGEKRLEKDPDLLAELQNEIVREWLRYRVRQCSASERSGSTVPFPKANADNPSGLLSMAKATQRSLYDEPLMGGKRLGDATRDEILDHVEMHSKLARSNAFKARWFQAIADAMPERARVQDCIAEAELAAMRTQAAA